MKNFKKAVAALLCTVLAFSASGCTSFKKPDKSLENPTDSTSAYPEPSTHDISLQHTEQKAEKTTTPPIKVENTQSYVDPYARDAKIYTEYLTGGALDEITEYTADKSFIEIESCMTDLNDDGTYELCIKLINKELLGMRGYETNYLAYTIINGKIKIISEAYYGGGTGGGNTLSIKYDSKTQKHVVLLSEQIREGAWAGFYYSTAYDFDGQELKSYIVTNLNYVDFDTEWYAEDIEKVKSETSYYYEGEYGINFYKIDGKYVSKEEYEEAESRFTDPTDSKYQMKKGTYSNPLGL